MIDILQGSGLAGLIAIVSAESEVEQVPDSRDVFLVTKKFP
jgi:hypothetical protein